MIKIEKGTPPTNTKLEQSTLSREGAKKPEEIKPLWKDPKIKEFLSERQHGKCCYCERRRDVRRESDVEHFRPKNAVEEDPNHKGYWWLAHDWDNLLVSCKSCNQEHKKTQFPLKEGSPRADSKNRDLTQEKPLLINPLEEDPEKSIEYDLDDCTMVKAIGKNEKGERTIEITDLNSTEKMRERLEFKETLKLIYDILKKDPINSYQNPRSDPPELEIYSNPNSRFCGLAKFFLKSKRIIHLI